MVKLPHKHGELSLVPKNTCEKDEMPVSKRTLRMKPESSGEAHYSEGEHNIIITRVGTFLTDSNVIEFDNTNENLDSNIIEFDNTNENLESNIIEFDNTNEKPDFHSATDNNHFENEKGAGIRHCHFDPNVSKGDLEKKGFIPS
ncbi:hypothetical protein STEG23_030782 [Scotinomys teguina]